MREIVFFGEYSFEKSPMVVTRGLDICDLPRKQLEILSILLEAGGEVVSREEIIDAVWQDVIVEEHNLTQTVFLLRRALGRLPDGEEYIETVPKRGYRIAPSAFGANRITPAELAPPPCNRRAGDYQTKRTSGFARVHLVSALTYVSWMVTVGVIILGTWAIMTGRFHLPHAYLVSIRQITRGGHHKEGESPILIREQTLFFSGHHADQGLVSRVDITGGDVTSNTLASGTGWVSGIHPTKNELLISHARTDGLIVTTSLSGTSPQPLGYLHGHSAVWSPDGRWVAFGRDHQLLVADKSGNSHLVVDHLPGPAFWLAWSPDSKTVRFSMQEDGDRRSLHEVEIKQGTVSTLLSGTTEEHHVCCGSWSPDGKYFVYLRQDAGSSEIWVRREGWTANTLLERTWKIADGPVDFWRSPVLSADRQHIYAIGEQMRNHLVSLNHGFAPFLAGVSIDSMSISHDGQWIAYTTYPEGVLWKSRLDGSERVQLSTPRVRVRLPQWSADDRSLIYLRAHDGDAWIVARMDAQSGSPERFIDGGTDIGTFSYTPVGDRIAFDSNTTPAGISILSLASRKVEQIPMSSDLSDGKWSPDGRYLAAVATNRRELRLFDTQTQMWGTIASAAELRPPTWDPKQNILYFVIEDDSRRSMQKYTVATRQATEVMDIPEPFRHEHASKVLTVAPDGNLLFGYSEGGVELYDLTVVLP